MATVTGEGDCDSGDEDDDDEEDDHARSHLTY